MNKRSAMRKQLAVILSLSIIFSLGLQPVMPIMQAFSEDRSEKHLPSYYQTERNFQSLTAAAAIVQPVNQLAIGDYVKVSSQQITRTLYNYTYTALIKNTGPALTNVTATLTSLDPHTTVIQGTVSFGNVGADSSRRSVNTFTIQQDRTFLFDEAGLYWDISYDPAVAPPPTANAGADQVAQLGSTVTLDGSASVGFNDTTIGYSWTIISKPSGSAAVLSNAGVARPTFIVDLPGNYVIELICSDASGSSAPSRVTVSVTAAKPVANAGQDQRVTVGDVVTLDGSKSSDLNGLSLEYIWSLDSRPSGSNAVLINANSVSPTFTVDRPGSYVARLIVRDAYAESDADTVEISTNNLAPIANAGTQQSVAVGSEVTLDGSKSTGLNGLPLNYTWSFVSKPAGSSAALTNSTTVNPKFTADVAGDYVARLVVSDTLMESAPTTVLISTYDVAPIAAAGAEQNVTAYSTVTLDGSKSSDPQNYPLTYKWSVTTQPAGGDVALSNDTIANPVFTPILAGTYVFQLIVNNGKLDSTPSTVKIEVTELEVAVPNVVGLQQAAATAQIEAALLRVNGTVVHVSHPTIPAGAVVSQNPAAGTTVKAGSSVSLEISTGPAVLPLTFTGSYSIPASTVGTAITSIKVADGVSGGSTPYTFSADNRLPAGITISSAGVISGTPTATQSAGTAKITVRDSSTPTAQTLEFSISYGTISAAIQPLAFSGNYSIPPSTVGTAITQITLSASGGVPPYTFSSDNRLPVGITISSAGSISGTPTTAQPAGTATITVTDNARNTANIEISFGAVSPAPLPLTFTYIAAYDIPASTVGTAIAEINVAVGVSGGFGTYSFSATGLPTGISISSAGVISGTPTTAQNAGTATITVTDSSSPTPQRKSITINFGAVSPAPQMVVVPNIAGKTRAEAEAMLQARGLTGTVVAEKSSATIPAGSIISQAPAPGTSMMSGNSVSLVLSKGLNDSVIIEANPRISVVGVDFTPRSIVDNSTSFLARWSSVSSITSVQNPDGSYAVAAENAARTAVYLLEINNSSGAITKEFKIDNLLPLFGGFTKDTFGNYYLFFGQNIDDSDTITKNLILAKYNSSGALVASNQFTAPIGFLSSVDRGVIHPFAAGSARLTISDDKLLVFFSREMHASPDDGRNHQAAWGAVYSINDLRMLTENPAAYSNYKWAVEWTSHCFNQSVIPIQGGGFAYVIHGDAYPRSAAVTVVKETSTSPQKSLFSFPGTGTTGDNTTNAQVGGIAESSTGFIIVGAYGTPNRNLFVQSVSKNMATVNTAKYLTNYENPDNAAHPKIVRIGTTDEFLVLWEKRTSSGVYNGTYGAIVGPTGDIIQNLGKISDTTKLNMYDDLHYNAVTGKAFWVTNLGNALQINEFDPKAVSSIGSGNINVRVVNVNGRIIENAQVSYNGTAFTYNNGIFSASALPTGNITLDASAPGYTSKSTPVLNLGVDSVTDIVLDGSSLGFSISDATGITATLDDGSVFSVYSNIFSYIGLPEGRYNVTLSKPGYVPVTIKNVQTFNNSSTYWGWGVITFQPEP